MNIAVLGTGLVGSCLAHAIARQGHLVLIGSRTPESAKVRDLLTEVGHGAIALTTELAAEQADMVVIALAWDATLPVLENIQASLVGKIVIDATNAIIWDNGPMQAADPSAGELVQAALPESQVVKAFNSIGIGHVLDPIFGGNSAEMFVAGNDSEAKQTVMEIADNMGFTPQDAGPIRNARLLESLAMLWIHMATVGGKGRDIAFALLTK